jgi:hypothetical protein
LPTAWLHRAGPVNFTIGTPARPRHGGGSASALLQYKLPRRVTQLGRILDINAVPRDKTARSCIDPAANAASVAVLSGLVQIRRTSSRAFSQRSVARPGFDFVMDRTSTR